MAQQAGHREGPIFQGLPFASTGAAQLTLVGMLAALYRRLDDGVGRHVETSLFDGALAFLSMMWGESDASVAAQAGMDLSMTRGSGMRLIRAPSCAATTSTSVSTPARWARSAG
jgi:crotonobetainyl-CoA:carnitine CoA-transferase CaiB-like acyl-CoA transferase